MKLGKPKILLLKENGEYFDYLDEIERNINEEKSKNIK